MFVKGFALAGLIIMAIASIALQAAEEKIVFTSKRDGDEEIYIMNPDGTNPVNLTECPDSNESEPTWSFDRTKIAFTTNREGWRIYVMNTDGTGQEELTAGGKDERAASWSPDGVRFALVTHLPGQPHHIGVVSASGGEVEELVQGMDPAWSPDGAKIAFSDERGNLKVITPDGEKEVTIIPEELEEGAYRYPAWSPDGRKIAFMFWPNKKGPAAHIFVMNVDGSELVQLTEGKTWNERPAWSPDGKKIAFTTSRDSNMEIYVMNADGTNAVNITSNPANDKLGAWCSHAIKESVEPTAEKLRVTWGEIKLH